MKSIGSQTFAAVATLALTLALPVSSFGQTPADGTYKSKCAGCHGADGTGSAMGKKLGAHNFQTAEVQGMSDADLTTVITGGKGKMPAYQKSLKSEDIKGLVAYIRTLKK